MVPPAVAVVVIFLALLVDRLLGDPHTPFHPVALLGRFIGLWGRPALYPAYLQRVAGGAFWVITAFLFTLPFFLFSLLAPWAIYLLAAPFFLKCCLAWRSLEEHTLSVASAVKNGVESGREKVRLLVSRDISTLDTRHILSAAYESMTENLTDSIVSPLFYYGIAGLPGAAVYRAANTMDAMLGYRDERLRLGNASARMDDILNYIPARLTVVLLLIWFAARGRFRPAWQIMRRDGHKRPGFNGGIVMAAMAGGCGIQFEKPGVYIIGIPERSLEAGGKDILAASRAVTVMFALVAACTVLLLGTVTYINYI
jgi:adenosylcobinamide-phosphate synthase